MPLGETVHRLTREKVRPTEQAQSVLRAREDPNGDAKKIEHMWVVTERLPVGKVKEDGRMVTCGWQEIRIGDFVDVLIAPEIVEDRTKKEKAAQVQVHYELRGIVQLRTGAEMKNAGMNVQKEQADGGAEGFGYAFDEEAGPSSKRVEDMEQD
ncbi:hypothetical protein EIP86_004696 [Pleurotus ostreatoroseus]|nr:hypothetical protein EIP86_004696 [Pleurotus ostreatoroseus]